MPQFEIVPAFRMICNPIPCIPFKQREAKRGEASLFISLPLSFEGEGDKGGEVV